MKMRLIIKREYMERVRSKWFLIGTLLAPLLISSIILIPIAIAKFSSTQKKIAVLDNSRQEQLLDRVVAKLQKDSGQDRLTIEAEKVDDTELQTRQAVLNARVEKGELQGYLLLSKQTVEQGTAEYYAKNVTDFVAIRQLSEALTKAVVERRLEMDGMDPARVEQLSKSVDLQTKKLQRGEAKVDRGQSFVLAFVLMMLIYVMLIAYGMTVLQSVVEEKQNRIVEVIISSVKPVELLFGKVIGIGLVGLTQLTIWLLFSLLMPTALASTVASIKTLMPDISPLLLVYFVIFPRLDAFTGGALSQRFADTGVTGRDRIALADLEIWRENFLFGVGPGRSTELHVLGSHTAAAHTEPTRLIAEHGLFGFFALLFLLVMGMRSLMRAEPGLGRAVAVSLLGWCAVFLVSTAMRLVAPAFVFGLACARIEGGAAGDQKEARA
ncbi:MAG: ABC transporter permease [Candidatus Bathyarchaeia archaeon]